MASEWAATHPISLFLLVVGVMVFALAWAIVVRLDSGPGFGTPSG
jgi:hypothetical protein